MIHFVYTHVIIMYNFGENKVICVCIRTQDRVQFSIYSTRALCHKYFVAMKYRWLCIFDFERKSTFNNTIYKLE